MDVDYQANKNLLDEAIKSGVKKFIYVSVLRGEDLAKVCVDALFQSQKVIEVGGKETLSHNGKHTLREFFTHLREMEKYH